MSRLRRKSVRNGVDQGQARETLRTTFTGRRRQLLCIRRLLIDKSGTDSVIIMVDGQHARLGCIGVKRAPTQVGVLEGPQWRAAVFFTAQLSSLGEPFRQDLRRRYAQVLKRFLDTFDHWLRTTDNVQPSRSAFSIEEPKQCALVQLAGWLTPVARWF